MPETQFKLLETSYVHGIMHDGILKGLEDGDVLPTITSFFPYNFFSTVSRLWAHLFDRCMTVATNTSHVV